MYFHALFIIKVFLHTGLILKYHETALDFRYLRINNSSPLLPAHSRPTISLERSCGIHSGYCPEVLLPVGLWWSFHDYLYQKGHRIM